jgi:hypothetical protein
MDGQVQNKYSFKTTHLTILTFPASDATCRANKQVLERRIGTATFGVDR